MENEIVKRENQQSFIERLVEKAGGLNEIKQVGEVIIASGFCPDHFKQSKDAVGVIMCIEAGRALGMSWMQALSDLYPVKGRIGMMGDAAVALIMGSGVLEYWHESTEGTYPNRDYKHIIVSKRKGFPSENRSEFSVFDAETAGLMSKDIYRKYGKRMLRYRNAGFHARDYFADILKGMKTVEELEDYDLVKPSGETKLITNTGKEMVIDSAKTAKSETISNGVSAAIDKSMGKIPVQEAEVVTEPEDSRKVYAEAELLALDNGIVELAKELLPQAKLVILNSGACGKRTKRLFVDAILAHQDGKLDEYMDAKLKSKQAEEPKVENTATQVEKVPPTTPNEVKNGNPEVDPMDTLLSEKPGAISTSEATKSFEAQRQVQSASSGVLFPNEEKEEAMVIAEIRIVNGVNIGREFPDIHKLVKYMRGPATESKPFQITEEIFPTLVKGTESEGKYTNLGDFCKFAKKEEVEGLIQKSM